MTEPTGATGTTTPATGEAAPAEPTNHDIKNHPLFQKVTAELADRNAADAKRVEAETAAKKEAEIKAVTDLGEYEKALQMRDDELERVKAGNAKQILELELGNELVKAEFRSELFIKGAVASYDPEAGSIADYVEGLAKDEANKPFMGTRTGIQAPGAPSVSGATNVLSVGQIRELQKSDKSEDRMRAIKYLTNFQSQHGKLPDGMG